MRITIIAFGTRGDVQPAVALGKALKAEGHSIRILAGANFKNWIERHGLEAIASQIDIQAVMESELGREWTEKGSNVLMQMRVVKKLLKHTGWQTMTDAWAACRDAEVIISSFTSDIYALSIAEKLDVRQISMPLQPALYPTRSGAATMNAPLPDRKSVINRYFGKLFLEPFQWRMSGDLVNRFRREVLSLKPQTRAEYLEKKRHLVTVQAYSRHVVPHAEDWPSTIRTTGFWFLEEQNEWKPSPELNDFLDSGDRPICIGFGSMIGRNLDQVMQTVRDAMRKSGKRAVLLSGWAGVGDTGFGEDIFCVEAAPHEWLYPRVVAAIHHGGAGSTGASLRAGVPTIIIPHLGDQAFWGQRVYSLGAGPRPILRKKLNPRALAAAITDATTNEMMKKKAWDLGSKIRLEDGLGQAVEIIDRYIRA